MVVMSAVLHGLVMVHSSSRAALLVSSWFNPSHRLEDLSHRSSEGLIVALVAEDLVVALVAEGCH